MQKKINSSYFKSQEKKNYQSCHITCIEDDNKNEINTPQEILDEIKHFYERLYTEKSESNENDSIFLDGNKIPKLSNEMKLECEKEISIDECTESLKQMKNGKSP